MKDDFEVAVIVIVVGFRNAEDVQGCLEALTMAEAAPTFEVFISENGGQAAFDALLQTLQAAGVAQLEETDSPTFVGVNARRVVTLRLAAGSNGAVRRVHVAEMPDNLGYAGAVNAWLRPLLAVPGWRGAWILNPDTAPAPDALKELQRYAAERHKGLVGSRLTLMSDPDCVQSRGLAWVKLKGSSTAIDRRASASVVPDPEDVERRLHSPSGASVYASRELIDVIGLMDERYFLYFEDLEWGCRAKALDAVGYAHQSIVVHKGGSTIGTAWKKADRSQLSVYLEFRNRLLFTRLKHPTWFAWTVVMQLVHASMFVREGALANARIALRGILAGLRGETGRPNHLGANVKLR